MRAASRHFTKPRRFQWSWCHAVEVLHAAYWALMPHDLEYCVG